MDIVCLDNTYFHSSGTLTMRLVHIQQQLRLRLRKRWLAISLNYVLQSHFCNCDHDDFRNRNLNSPNQNCETWIGFNCIAFIKKFVVALILCDRNHEHEISGFFHFLFRFVLVYNELGTMNFDGLIKITTACYEIRMYFSRRPTSVLLIENQTHTIGPWNNLDLEMTLTFSM